MNMADKASDLRYRGKLSEPLRPFMSAVAIVTGLRRISASEVATPSGVMIPVYKMPLIPPTGFPRRRSLTLEELDRLIIQHGLPPANAVKTSPNAYLPQMTPEQRFAQDWPNAHLAPELSRVSEMTSQRLTPELAAQRATPEMVRLDPSVVASYLSRHGKSPPPPSTAQAQHLGHLAAPSQALPQRMYISQGAVGITALTQGMRKEESPRQSQAFPRHSSRSPVLGRTNALTSELQKPVSSQPWTMMPQSNYLASHPVYSRQASAPSDLRDLSKIHVQPTQLITNNNSVNQNANVSQLMAALNMPGHGQLVPPHGASSSLPDINMASLQQQVSNIPAHELNKLMRLMRNGQGSEYPHRDELPYSDLERQSPEPPVLTRAESLPQASDVYGQYGEADDYAPPVAGRLVNDNPFFPPGLKAEGKERSLQVPDVIVEDENGRQIPVCEEENKMETRSNPFSMRVDILNKFPHTASASRYRSQAVALHRAKAGCILGAAKSLDLLRQNLQRGFNKEIEDLITRYIDAFFKPACDNIRRNQGETAINNEHLQAIRRQMLDDAKKMYCDNESIAPGEVSDNVSEAGSHHDTRKKHLLFGRRRKHSDSDSEASQPVSRKKKGRHGQSGRSTPSKVVKEPVRREGPKWDPERVTAETLFVMGAKANKALGLGNTRGRLYIKHADVFKYTGDQEDKEWLFAQGRMPLTGGRTYMLMYEDIKDLSESPEYVSTSMLMHILQGFTVPEWMLEKVRAQMAAQRTDKKAYGSRSGTPSVTPTQDADTFDGEEDASLDQFEFGKLPFSSSRSHDSRSEVQPSPANTDLDLLSNTDDPDLSPLARSQQFDVSPIPDVSPSPSDLDGIDEEAPLSATFDLAY